MSDTESNEETEVDPQDDPLLAQQLYEVYQRLSTQEEPTAFRKIDTIDNITSNLKSFEWYHIVIAALRLSWSMSPVLILGLVAVTFMTSSINLAVPTMLQKAIDAIAGTTELDQSNYYWIVIMYGLSKIFRTVLLRVDSFLSTAPTLLLRSSLELSAVLKALHMPIEWFNKRGTDKIASLTTRYFYVEQLVELILSNNLNFVLRLVSSYTLAINVLPRLWWVLLAPLPFYGALVWWVDSLQETSYTSKELSVVDDVSTNEIISMTRDIKIFGAERDEVLRYARISGYRDSILNKADVLRSLSYVGQELIQTAGCVVMMMQISKADISVGQLSLLLNLQESLFAPISMIHHLATSTRNSVRNARPFFQLLAEVDPLQDRKGAVDLPVLAEKVSFKNVSFSYDEETSEQSLKKVSFDIPAGKTTAIVGPSGAGKSTIANLLLRLYDVSSGEVLWDGIDIRDGTRKSLRKLACLVPQDISLMNRTIHENISFGFDATMEQIEEAARIAHAHDFIEELEYGYQTMVGERGVLLSGGQRQRIALARAVLRRPCLMILDEATSHLDAENEKFVQEAIEQLDKTTKVVIAHRFSTVLRADQILVVDHGKIVGRGTHRELVESCPLYQRLWELQTLE